MTITVMEVSGQTVRLGIDAPKSLAIYREEIWAAVRRENEAAAVVPPSMRHQGHAGSVS